MRESIKDRPFVRWSVLYRAAAVLVMVAFAHTPEAQQGTASPQTSSAAQRDAPALRARRFLQGRSIARPRTEDGPGTSNSQVTPSAQGSVAEALAGARREHAGLRQTAVAMVGTSLGAAWQAVGPNQIASMAYGTVTGRITSIAVDPADPTGNTVYVGSTGGGVWKSTNAAGPAASVVFTPLTDTLPVFSGNAGTTAIPSLSIGALSIQPGGQQGEVILAGTGDPNDATDSYYGSGILRSADGGNTWTLAQGSRDGVAGNHSFLGLGTAGFAWSTASPSLVVAAMSQSAEGVLVNAPDTTNSVLGLYFSTNAGVTWQMATVLDGTQTVQTPLPAGANAGGNAATAVVWNPVRQRFFAAVRFHGVYQSSDGMTWTRLAHQPGTGLTTTACPTNPGTTGSPACPIFRGALAVQPVSGDTFALTVDASNLDQGLWQDACASSGTSCASSNVAFATQIVSTPLERGSGSSLIAQGDYDLSLAATPASTGDTHNTVLYAGTIDLFRCAFVNGAAAGCFLRNTTNALNGCGATSMVAPAQHALGTLALGAPLVYVGNDGGLWRSTDGVAQSGTACTADDATHFQNLNGGFGSLAETVSLAAAPTDAETLLVGVGANGTAFTSSASSALAWPQLAAGEGGFVAIDQAAPKNFFVSTGPGVSIAHCGKGPGCAAADFAGEPTIGATQVANDAALVDAPFLLDPALTTDVLIGTCRVWRGPADDGSLWSSGNAISKDFGGPPNASCTAGTNPLVRSLAAGGPASGAGAAQDAGSTVLYAGLAGSYDGGGSLAGHVFRTTAGGTAGPTTAWTDTAGTNVTNDVADGGHFNPGGFDVSSVVADPHDATGKTVYATVMGFTGNGVNAPHVYRTLDGGASWTNISSNLPNSPANSLVVDPNDANTLYLAMDTGVYVATQVATCSSANCWSVFGAGLPNAPVMDLVASAGVATGDGRIGELRAGTYGRGVWQVPLLTASTLAQPAITVTPTSLTFAAQAVATQSAAQSVTVANTGDAPLTISSITVTGDFTESDGCTANGANVLAAGASCTVQVRFLPTASGARTGVLTVFGNAPGGQATVTLSGTATAAAAIVLNPIALVFPSTAVGATSAAINLTISNTGGTAAGLQVPMISGGDFRLSANTCGATLAAQTGCTVSVVFQPTASGARSGSFSITDDAGMQMATLSGTATTPATDALGPLSLSFGSQVLNTTSATQFVTLTNSGDVPLTLIGAQITSGDFTAVNGCGNSLNGHSSCTIGIAFVPKSVGLGVGVMTVSDQFRSQMVALNGTGLAPAGVSLSPFAGLVFGPTAVGTMSSAQTVTLTNNGGIALLLQGIAFTGDFSMVSGSNTCGATLQPAAACTVQVIFAPAAGGAQTGSLVFTDSAAGSPQTLTLAGTGVDFALTANGPTTVTVASGTSAVFPLLLTSASGTPGTVSFTCLGAPANATCNVTPANPALGGATTIAVTIATGLSTTAAVGSGTDHAGSPAAAMLPERLLWLASVLPLGLLTMGGGRRIRRGLGMTALILCGALGMLAGTGCGTARQIPDTGGTSSAPAGPLTPSGSYSIAVSATSAGLTRTVNVTLIVQ